MKVKILNKDEALRAGSDLWILPQLGHSEWTKQFDWPLNLQITRAAHHDSPELSAELKRTIQENELDLKFRPNASGPLMISTNGLLPTRIVAIMNDEKFEKWVSAGLKLWQNLKAPSVRIFLPLNVKWQTIEKDWPPWADAETVTIVESLGS